MKKDYNLILSTASLIYFASLIFISYKNIVLNDVLEAVFELSTIPFILLVPVLVIFSFKGWHADKWAVKSKSFLSVLILTATIFLVIVATVYNI
jgi:hypothetical protein